MLALPIEGGPGRVPGVEDRPYGEVELLAGVLGEAAPGVLQHERLVGAHQLAQVVDVEAGIVHA